MKLDLNDTQPAPGGAMPTIFEAIVRRRCIVATYNKVQVVLAPHILYTRHDAPYVDAITISRDSSPPKEEKLGAFKVDGLNSIAMVEREFAMSKLYDAQSDKYSDVTLLSVEG